jgi:hypothetical protein
MGMVKHNRRAEPRVALQMFINEYVKDQPFRSLATNLSPTGLRVDRLPRSADRTRMLGLEFQLPGTSEVIWARGEVRFDAADPYFQSTGILITGIASSHQRLLRDYVMETRIRQLRRLMATVRRNRRH